MIDSRAKIKQCDLYSVENPYEFLCKPDVLLHLAWSDGFVHYSNAHIDDLPKHFNCIKCFAKAGCKHIAAMGSMH